MTTIITGLHPHPTILNYRDNRAHAFVRGDFAREYQAHRLRNVYKKAGSARAKNLKDALAELFKILLTATPLQNSLMELYGLVSIVDGQFFGDETTFKTMYGGSRPDILTLNSLKMRITPIYKRHLRRDVQEAGHVSFTRRMATTFDFESSDTETALYENVSAYLQRPDSIAFGLKPNQLVIIQARKILGSSVAAIAGFLATVRERLESQQVADIATVADADDTAQLADELNEAAALDDDADKPSVEAGLQIDQVKLKAEIAELDSYLALAKGEKLIARLPEVLDEIEKRGGKRKAVIFTESVRTQTYLAGLLTANGYAGQLVLLNGSNSDSGALSRMVCDPQRHGRRFGLEICRYESRVVDAFRSDEKTILIATQSGAEGINLQFCSLLVNLICHGTRNG